MQVISTTAAAAGRRKLAQGASAGLVTYMFKAAFPGSEEPVNNALTRIKQDPCTVPEWCEKLQEISVLHGSGQVITNAYLNLTLISYDPGSMRLSTAYFENNALVGDTPVLLTSSQDAPNRGRLVSCTTQLLEGTRMWVCQCYIAAGESIRVTAVAHNPSDTGTTLASTIEVSAPGKEGVQGLLSVGLQHADLTPALEAQKHTTLEAMFQCSIV